MKITVLCKVVDNFGDIGVVYRLCRALTNIDPQIQIRLVVSDLVSFSKLAEKVDPKKSVQEFHGWKVFDWNNDAVCREEFENDIPQIILECFQCGRPDWLEDILFAPDFEKKGITVQIVNIEYLTAESWADDFHLLKSGTRSSCVKKINFMPGFTEKTAGLIQDNAFMSYLKDSGQRMITLKQYVKDHFKHYLYYSIVKNELMNSSYKILVFSYPKNFDFFYEAVDEFAANKHVEVYVANGAGYKSFRENKGYYRKKNFNVTILPYLNQQEWDAFLCNMDFLMIRGEDSFSRAVLSGIPFIWNIYPQDEEYHLVKLKAFLDRLDISDVNEFSYLYNRNFELEECSDARDVWGNITECKDNAQAQVRMKELLLDILNKSDELKLKFKSFAEQTEKLGNLAEKLYDWLKVLPY